MVIPLAGAGPAAAAIISVALPLTLVLREAWQLGVLAAAALSLVALCGSVIVTLLGAGVIGIFPTRLGALLP